MTVVIQYEDDAELPSKLTDAFKSGQCYKGAKVTAVSLEDEITNVEKLELLTETVTTEAKFNHV